LLPSFTLRVWVWISSQNLYNTHPVRVNAFSAVSRSFQSRFLGPSESPRYIGALAGGLMR
jgi:hypothetical protein